MPELVYTETLVTTQCWCGIHLAVPDNLLRWAKQTSRNAIYCPIGHEFVFNNSFEEKYKAERERARATRELLRAEERAHSATKSSLTKVKKRAANGICPCCHRSFVQLNRHMKTKHPDYVEESK